MVLTPIFDTVDNGWVQGRVKELPAVITAAPTREQAREQLADALREYIASLRADGLPLPVEIDDASEVQLA